MKREGRVREERTFFIYIQFSCQKISTLLLHSLIHTHFIFFFTFLLKIHVLLPTFLSLSLIFPISNESSLKQVNTLQDLFSPINCLLTLVLGTENIIPDGKERERERKIGTGEKMEMKWVRKEAESITKFLFSRSTHFFSWSFYNRNINHEIGSQTTLFSKKSSLSLSLWTL